MQADAPACSHPSSHPSAPTRLDAVVHRLISPCRNPFSMHASYFFIVRRFIRQPCRDRRLSTRKRHANCCHTYRTLQLPRCVVSLPALPTMFAPIFVIAPRRAWLPNLNFNLDILLASIKPLEAARVVTRTADPRQISCARGLPCQHTELASSGGASATQDVVLLLERCKSSFNSCNPFMRYRYAMSSWPDEAFALCTGIRYTHNTPIANYHLR